MHYHKNINFVSVLLLITVLFGCSKSDEKYSSRNLSDFEGSWESMCQSNFNEETNIFTSAKQKWEFTQSGEYTESISGNISDEDGVACSDSPFTLILSSGKFNIENDMTTESGLVGTKLKLQQKSSFNLDENENIRLRTFYINEGVLYNVVTSNSSSSVVFESPFYKLDSE